jgi:hypothetical protein
MQQVWCRRVLEPARAQLDKIKPVFMLAECDQPELHEQAFDASYDWSLSNIMIKIGKGEAGAADLRNLSPSRPRPTRATPTVCSSQQPRHQLVAGHGQASVWPGVWRHGGAELHPARHPADLQRPGSALEKRLAFFEKDPIEWKNIELELFFAGLNALKKAIRRCGTAPPAALQMLDVGNDSCLPSSASRARTACA